MIVSTEAIVLHSRRFGDTSRIVVLYTEVLGKISVVAKGVRKPTSPMGSALEPLSHSFITVYHNKNRELHTVSAAEQRVRRQRLTSSLEHLTAAMLLTECVMRTQADHEPQEPIWEMLRKGLEDMEGATEPYAVAVGTRLQLAELMGFGLPFVEAAAPVAMLSVSAEDGVPRDAGAPGIRMSGAAYALMHAYGTWMHNIVASDAQRVASDAQRVASDVQRVASDAQRTEIESFLTLYFSHHLDRRIVSRSFDVLG